MVSKDYIAMSLVNTPLFRHLPLVSVLPPKPGFLNLNTTDILGQIILCVCVWAGGAAWGPWDV